MEAFGTQQLQDLSSSLFLSSFPLSLFYLWSLLILSSLSYSILPPNPPNSFSDSFCVILQLTPLIHQHFGLISKLQACQILPMDDNIIYQLLEDQIQRGDLNMDELEGQIELQAQGFHDQLAAKGN